MKIFKFSKLLLVSIFILAIIGACGDLFEKRDLSLDAEPQLEFFPLSQTLTDAADGPDASTVVQLIAPQRSSELTISYQVDAENSTAVEGTHYTISSGSSPITLGVNTSTTDPIVIEIIDDSVPDGEERILVLVLQDAEDVIASPNLNTYTLTIQGAN